MVQPAQEEQSIKGRCKDVAGCPAGCPNKPVRINKFTVPVTVEGQDIPEESQADKNLELKPPRPLARFSEQPGKEKQHAGNKEQVRNLV